MQLILAIIISAGAIFALSIHKELPEHDDNAAPQDRATPSYTTLLHSRVKLAGWGVLVPGICHILATILAIIIHTSGNSGAFGMLLTLVVPFLASSVLCIMAALTYPGLRPFVIIGGFLAGALILFLLLTSGLLAILAGGLAVGLTGWFFRIVSIGILIHSMMELHRIKWHREKEPEPKVIIQEKIVEKEVEKIVVKREKTKRQPRKKKPDPKPVSQPEPIEPTKSIIALELVGDSGKLIILPDERMPRPLYVSEYNRISSDVAIGKPPFAFISPNKEGKGKWLLEPMMEDLSSIFINNKPLSDKNADMGVEPESVITMRDECDDDATCGTLVIKYKILLTSKKTPDKKRP